MPAASRSSTISWGCTWGGGGLSTLSTGSSRGLGRVMATELRKLAAEHGGQHLGHFRLAEPGVPFDQHRLAQPNPQENRGRQRAIGHVPLLFESPNDRIDVRNAVRPRRLRRIRHKVFHLCLS